MGISHSGHCIDLKVLVRTNTGSVLNCPPVGPCWFSVIEPLVGHMLDVVCIHLRNTSSHLATSDITAKSKHLASNLLVHNFAVVIPIHKVVVKMIAGSNNLDVIDVVTVDCGHANTAVIHLSNENFISEKVVAPNSTIRVWEVVGICDCHIWEDSKHTVMRIVLLFHTVKISCMSVNSVVTEHVF